MFYDARVSEWIYEWWNIQHESDECGDCEQCVSVYTS
jgi:hypothetical protein